MSCFTSLATIDPRPRLCVKAKAEAVAFIVGTAIGIRSSVDPTDSIQLYEGNGDTFVDRYRIQASAKTIRTALPLETPRWVPVPNKYAVSP